MNQSELERHVSLLMAERGIPVDEIAAGVKTVGEHIRMLDNAHPGKDLSVLLARLKTVEENATANTVGAFTNAVRRFRDKNGSISHDFAYVHDAAEDLHQAILDKNATPDATPATAPVDEN